jgi:putative transposase
VNIKRIARLMKIMGIEAVHPKPNTSKPASGAQKYPYLLKGLDIIKPNQVWASDITYIPTSRGFVYLTAIIDWYSRFVLSWELSTSMDMSFYLSALEKATENYGVPEIFNTDQGSQYISVDFTSYLNSRNIKISHDSRRRCFDNIMIERIWRSVKYENVYLRDYNTVAEAREGLDEYLNFYNTMRPHQSLGYMTPKTVYNDKLSF